MNVAALQRVAAGAASNRLLDAAARQKVAGDAAGVHQPLDAAALHRMAAAGAGLDRPLIAAALRSVAAAVGGEGGELAGCGTGLREVQVPAGAEVEVGLLPRGAAGMPDAAWMAGPAAPANVTPVGPGKAGYQALQRRQKQMGC